jgi:uncharacterized membrane protein YhhN
MLSLSVAALVSAALGIFSRDRVGWRTIHYVFKPITTILIIILAGAASEGSSYAVLIIAGLAFSLLGDIALMLPEGYFLAGLGSFAVTHALYLVAFVGVAGWALVSPTTAFVVLIALMLGRWLWPGIRRSLRIPVLIYIVLISTMLSQVLGATIEEGSSRIVLAALGASLFFISDGLLAVNRFRMPFKGSSGAVLSTYWIGQWLIALSVQPELLGMQ